MSEKNDNGFNKNKSMERPFHNGPAFCWLPKEGGLYPKYVARISDLLWADAPLYLLKGKDYTLFG